MKDQYRLIEFNLNGKDVACMVDCRASLTDMLRNDFRLTSVKKGCEVGECGACNVLINGECFNSCIYLAVWADGKEILTLEGLEGPNGELSDIQQAFIDEAAVQCACHCEFRPESLAEPDRNDQPSLRIQIVVILSRKHPATIYHFLPLLTTC